MIPIGYNRSSYILTTGQFISFVEQLSLCTPVVPLVQFVTTSSVVKVDANLRSPVISCGQPEESC